MRQTLESEHRRGSLKQSATPHRPVASAQTDVLEPSGCDGAPSNWIVSPARERRAVDREPVGIVANVTFERGEADNGRWPTRIGSPCRPVRLLGTVAVESFGRSGAQLRHWGPLSRSSCCASASGWPTRASPPQERSHDRRPRRDPLDHRHRDDLHHHPRFDRPVRRGRHGDEFAVFAMSVLNSRTGLDLGIFGIALGAASGAVFGLTNGFWSRAFAFLLSWSRSASGR